MSPMHILFGFTGRLRRRDWWLWGIGASVVYFLVYTVVGGILFGPTWWESAFGEAMMPPSQWALELVLMIPMTWVSLAIAVKRGHDRGHSAWWLIALNLSATLFSYAPGALPWLDLSDYPGAADTAYLVASVASLGINFVLLVLLGCLDGTPGPNRYGPSPKGIGGDLPSQTARVFD